MKLTALKSDFTSQTKPHGHRMRWSPAKGPQGSRYQECRCIYCGFAGRVDENPPTGKNYFRGQVLTEACNRPPEKKTVLKDTLTPLTQDDIRISEGVNGPLYRFSGISAARGESMKVISAEVKRAALVVGQLVRPFSVEIREDVVYLRCTVLSPLRMSTDKYVTLLPGELCQENENPTEVCQYLVTGRTTKGKFTRRFAGTPEGKFAAMGINLWKGRVWEVDWEGKRKCLRNVIN